MKKIILCFILPILSASSFGQQNKLSPSSTYKAYMQKSKHRKTVAWVLLGGGAALAVTEFLIPRGANKGPSDYWLRDNYKNDRVKSTIGECITFSVLGSIYFFISAHHKRAMAASAYFKMEQAPQFQKSNLISKAVHCITLKIYL